MKGEDNVGNIEIYKLLEKENIAAKNYCIYPRNTIFSFKKKGDTAAHVHQISTPVPVDVMFSFLL
jgi:hypothetical protein